MGLFDEETNPGNRTDIVIENNKKIQLIIDAKFYKEALVKKYYSENELTYRASHANKVRGYMIDSDYN